MKLSELSDYDKETLYFEARDIPTGKLRPFCDKPNWKQLHALRCAGYFIGPQGEVLRAAMTGNLRECAHGIPCTWYCTGWAEGKCPERPFPACGVPMGECLATGNPCGNEGCTGMNTVYETRDLSVEQKKELCRKAHKVCDRWWADELDCRKSWARQVIVVNFEEFLQKLDDKETLFHAVHRCSDFENHLEVGFRAMTSPVDYFLWIVVKPDLIPQIVEGLKAKEL